MTKLQLMIEVYYRDSADCAAKWIVANLVAFFAEVRKAER